MAEIAEKSPEIDGSQEVHPTTTTTEGHTEIARPDGWMYKQRKIGGLTIPWYASPRVQLFLVAMVCFMCPGMYNALSGLGGGGQLDPVPADHANTALNSTFAIVGFFAGTFVNRLGIKLTLSLGGLGYCIYASSLLCYSHTQNSGFLIFAGALLGVCAGLLWTAQGTIMMSYPMESSKGRFIAYFWVIFNLGSVIGSLIPLGENIHSTGNSTVSDGTYIGFIVLMFAGAILALCLCNATNVVREDGSHVVLMKNPTWVSEFKGLWETLRYDSYIILLFPMFFASNWFYTYQFNGINSAHFNTRTRALNNTLYWSSQILGAFIFGSALDVKSIRRSLKAKCNLAALVVVTMVIWGGGYAYQRNAAPKSVTSATDYVKMDWKDPGYVGPMFLYMFYGFYDAAWQTSVYWLMGSLSNSGRKTANFAGFYKGIQSAGATIISAVDGTNTSYTAEFGASWGLLAGSLLIAAPVFFFRVQDHVDVEQDLKFSDETIEDVLPITHVNEKAENV